MKKALIVGILTLFLALPAIGLAGSFVISSGELTSSAAVVEQTCFLVGVLVATDGTNDVTVTIYDNTAASGKKLMPTFTVPGGDCFYPVLVPYVFVVNGIYASMSGDGDEKVTILYSFTR